MKCEICGKEGATRKAQNTAYADDELNYAVLCDDCQKEADEYWRERWDEYWREVL